MPTPSAPAFPGNDGRRVYQRLLAELEAGGARGRFVSPGVANRGAFAD